MTITQRVVHTIDFDVVPMPGTALLHEGQRYVVTGSDLHRRKDGELVPIIYWQSYCAECGAPFECWSGMRSGTLNRRCRLHHAPGKAVTAAGKKHASNYLRKYGPRRKR